MKFGSLFSGIGGLDLAVEACGWSPAWQVENDPFCTKILERHWSDVRRYGDIREIDWRDVERVELVSAGFPCQPWSVAGQNRGEDDKRNMWPETIRAVRELEPRYVFLENVPGLLAHGYFGRILGDLAQGGYDAVWDTFTAAEVGAVHERERLFLLAYHVGERIQGLWSQPLRGLSILSWGKDVRGPADLRGRPDIPEPLVWGSGNGIPYYVDRLRALGNAVVPAQGAYALRSLWRRVM